MKNDKKTVKNKNCPEKGKTELVIKNGKGKKKIINTGRWKKGK